ncbi:prepilin-type N-terminal cleavage/methylation domain-containing protein [Streptomyces sp. Isolate_45]|uniref:prepilin-type N-terminal cleavage/methylation domain-containing protein n=1 Tax=Streptomyces sp. Isolate_45 TaxID=2950111 RepID=UPI002481D931|nr:prepilin-type N-terminal cleavage/methylation domain-containing protein [Streptomyces sp. Isolate_45]
MRPDHRPFPMRARRQDGFTLIELLVVIVILGVLAAIVVFSVRGLGDKGRGSAVAADAATLRTAEESFCAKHGHYGTVDDLKADGLLAGEPSYNMVAVGEENKCGRGAKSSFTLYDTSPSERTGDPIPAGQRPTDLTVDEKANRVYVVSDSDNTVTVIDGKTDKAIGAPINVSSAVSSPTRIAVNSATGQVYVGGANSVAVIDTANDNQLTRVSFSAIVSGLAVSPDNGDVYVSGGSGKNSALAYIAAGIPSATATPIPLPSGAGLANAAAGMDFSFDAARHAVYFTKQANGGGASPNIGLFAISTQTHEVRVVAEFPTVVGCLGSTIGSLTTNSAKGMIAVDPNRNLVYLLATRCAPRPELPGEAMPVGTTIVIDPSTGESTAIDELPGAKFGPSYAVYSTSAASVYVFSTSTTAVPGCGGSGGRISRVEGKAVTRQALTCGYSGAASANVAHKLTLLKNFNRVFVAQTTANLAPGGLAVTDGTTLLTQAPLGSPRQFGSLAVNNATDKLYALDPDGKAVMVFRTGPA